MSKFLKDKYGYTASEMIVFFLVMAILATIAFPNYFRIKMQVNMELVKQNLRIISQEMNEFYNKNKQFPASIEDIKNSASPQAMSITESLDSIQQKGYEVIYLPNSEQTSYTQRVEPILRMEGKAGNKCFILDPMGVRDLPCWNGEGTKMEIWGYPYLDFAYLIQFVLNDAQLDETQKATILSGMIEYFTSKAVGSLNGKLKQGQSPGYAFPIFESVKGAFDSVFPKMYDILKRKGLRVYGTFLKEPSLLKSGHLEIPVQAGEYHIGAQMTDSARDFEYDKEYQSFRDYVQKVCSGESRCNGNLDSWNSQTLILSS